MHIPPFSKASRSKLPFFSLHLNPTPMPGTIQVSVVGLMDFPKAEASSSPFSLKIAMGRREYQCMVQSDCSVPVMSLRENLIVAIQNAAGDEIFQTEFKTISVVEKGLLEDSYPLTSGGYVRIKLQFLLSQEEHVRVREMRESAWKRKRGERLMIEINGPISGQRNGNWIVQSISEEGMIRDQSQKSDPDLQVSEQPSNLSFNGDMVQMMEASPKNLKIQSSLDGISKHRTSSEVGLDHKPEFTRSSVSGNATEHSYPDSTELNSQQPSDLSVEASVAQMMEASQENLKIQSSLNCVNECQLSSEVGSSDPKSECLTSSASENAAERSYSDSTKLKETQRPSNVKKMVTAFERSIFQGPDPHSVPRTTSSVLKVDIEVSSKRDPSKGGDVNKLKFPRTILKSFSAGMLSDMNSQQDPKLFRSAFMKKQEETENLGPAERSETMGKEKVALESKIDRKLKSQDTAEPKAVKGTTRAMRTVSSAHFTEHLREGDGPASILFNESLCLSLKRDFKASEEILNLPVASEGSKFLDTQTISETTDPVPSSRSGEQVEAGTKQHSADVGSLDRDSTCDGNEIGGRSITQHVPLFKIKKFKGLPMEEMKKDECATLKETRESRKVDHPGRLSSCQQGSSLNAASMKENESDCSGSCSDEEAISATLNEIAKISTYFDSDGCHFGNNDIWNTRRVCITSGTRQLRDLVDFCTKMEKNPSIESGDQNKPHDDASVEAIKSGKSPIYMQNKPHGHASVEAIKSGKSPIYMQNKPHDDASVEAIKSGKSPCMPGKPNPENSVGISKSIGGLIEQGVRIAIVIVACGILLFNTKQRKRK